MSSSSSTSRIVAGPSLPAGFKREVNDDDDVSSADEQVGPALPTSGSHEGSSSNLNHGARVFLERESRRKEAQEQATRDTEREANSRPDWMLLPPSLSNSASLQSVAGDPLSLKSRGFAQNTPRVSSRSTGVTAGAQGEATSLWTETPQQRLQRLQDEAAGIKTPSSKAEQEAVQEHELQKQRDRVIAEQVRAQRKEKTLVEEHRERRRQERKHADRRIDKRQSDDDDERRRTRHSRHRSRSRSPSPTRHRHRDDRSSRSHKDAADRESRRHRKRSHKGDATHPKEEKERKLTRQEREDLDLQNGRMAAPSIWDRESALSVGAKLMDEKKRGKLLADANALGDRFGSGSKRFM